MKHEIEGVHTRVEHLTVKRSRPIHYIFGKSTG